MKKFVEILEEIKQTCEAIRAAEANEKKLIDSYIKLEDIKSRIAKKRAVESEMIKNSENIKNLKITMKILKNNARVALFYDVLPVALEILAKYSGKPYGEKTRQKISDEVKEKTNCRFYISSRYGSHSFEVYPVDGFGNDYNISCGTEYINGNKKPLLVDNKIQLVTFEEIALYYISREYVENVPQRVEELKAIYKEAVAKQKELESICSRYNSLAVGDLSHIYHDKRIYENMEI